MKASASISPSERRWISEGAGTLKGAGLFVLRDSGRLDVETLPAGATPTRRWPCWSASDPRARRSAKEWARSMGDQIRAAAELGRGDAVTADRYARMSLRAIWRLGDVMGSAMAVERLAACAVAMGDAVRAARLLGVGGAAVGRVRPDPLRPARLRRVAGRTDRRTRRVLGERAYLEAYGEGRRHDPRRRR